MSFRDPRLRRLRRAGGRLGGVRPGAETASGGGTTVRVGGVDQSDYLLAYSLTLRLGSFDFTLINPATVPVVGNMVYLLEPAWDGQVVSVSHKDVPRGTDKFYTITATNAKVATTSAAPFALSDVADSVTSFPYRDLTITTSRTDAGSKTQGTFTTWQQGLWPGMTFSLTSANFGLSAQTYAISNVTVTWPVKSTAPEFAVEFGDAQIGLTQLAVNSGGLSTEADGTTTLKDPLGNLIFNSATGFGSAWRRFLLSGVYNGDWAAGPVDPANVIIDVTNPVPSWTFVRIGGTGINATWVSDPSQGSGYVLRFTMSAGVADDQIVLEQLLPINASRNRAYSYRVRAYFFNGSASASPGGLVTLEMQYMRKDGSTTTGTAESNTGAVITAVDMVTALAPSVVPADAYFIRVRVGLKRDTAAVGTTAQVDLAEVRLEGGIGTALMVPDDPDPTTNGVGYIYQNNKILTLVSGYGSAAGTRGTIQLSNSYLKLGATAQSTGGAGFPVTPTPLTNDLYYRTDLAMWFYYNGSIWLSTTLYTDDLGTVGIPPFAVTTSSHWLSLPLAGSLAIYIENFWVSFYIVAGTALSGSHKWTVGFVTLPGGTVTNTYTINSGAVDTWRNSGAQAVGAAVPLTDFVVSGTSTKTGTPGNIYPFARITYRLIAT